MLYFNNFWQAYTSVNFLSQAYFIFLIISKQRTSFSFNSAACQHSMCTKLSSCFITRCQILS